MSPPARILVTGASRGIGRAVAERLLAAGRAVVLTARDAAALDRVAAIAPDRAAVLALDLAQERGVFARATRAFGGLDGLVHAAGVAPHAAFEAITDEQLERALDLHVRVPLRLSRELAAELRDEGRPGAIVHVASTLGLRPARGTLVYSATKAALVSMTRTMALELAPHEIRVNAVAPGVVDTEMARTLRLAPGEPEPAGEEREARVAAQLEELRRLHPIGRLGTPADVAEAVLYLLDASWVTGTVLTADGGLTAG